MLATLARGCRSVSLIVSDKNLSVGAVVAHYAQRHLDVVVENNLQAFEAFDKVKKSGLGLTVRVIQMTAAAFLG